MATIDHQWVILATQSGDSAKVVVVCSACGLTRSGNVPTAAIHDHYVDLRGDCTGEPQAQSVSPVDRQE